MSNPRADTRLQKYHRVSFLDPLIAFMTLADPNTRPTAKTALKEWERIRKRI